VTKPEESNRVLEETRVWNDGNLPDIVWANAGYAQPGLFADTSIETLRAQMDINYWGAAYLAHATLNLWTKTGASSTSVSPRHFIMTSSTIAFVGLAGYATYAPAKAAMRSLADCLRSEVNLYNGARQSGSSQGPPVDINIHIVHPGTILSPGFKNEEKTKHPVTRILEKDDPKQTEDEVALAAMKGLEHGQFMVTTQYLGNLMRVSMLGGSKRGNALFDTILSWVTSIAWPFIAKDMDDKVFKYGKTHGLGSAS